MNNSDHYQNKLAQDRFGLQISALLSDSANNLPYDISERLRATRMQALAKRKIAATSTAVSVSLSGGVASLTFGNEKLGWLNRITTTMLLLALIVGLIAINAFQNDDRANELAEIDIALLTDDLPPTAYTDQGFAHFIKLRSVQNQ